jgi:hypothetical protein
MGSWFSRPVLSFELDAHKNESPMVLRRRGGGRRATAAARGERWAYLKLEIRAADSQNLSWNCRWQVIREECASFNWPNVTYCRMISMFKQVSTSTHIHDDVPNPRNRWLVVRGERVFGRWRTEEGGKKVIPASTHAHTSCLLHLLHPHNPKHHAAAFTSALTPPTLHACAHAGPCTPTIPSITPQHSH